MIQLNIYNDGTGNEEVANYDVILLMPGDDRRARVEGFRRSRGWTALLTVAMAVLMETERRGP